MGSIHGAYYCVMKLLIILYFLSSISRIINAGSEMGGLRCTREYMLQHFLNCIKFLEYLISRLEWSGQILHLSYDAY